MNKIAMVFVACGVLAHIMAVNCNAIGVINPITNAQITEHQDFQADGVSVNNIIVLIEWYDGTGARVAKQNQNPNPATPFNWQVQFTLPVPMGVNKWTRTTIAIKSKCQMKTGGVVVGAVTNPPIVP